MAFRTGYNTEIQKAYNMTTKSDKTVWIQKLVKILQDHSQQWHNSIKHGVGDVDDNIILLWNDKEVDKYFQQPEKSKIRPRKRDK